MRPTAGKFGIAGTQAASAKARGVVRGQARHETARRFSLPVETTGVRRGPRASTSTSDVPSVLRRCAGRHLRSPPLHADPRRRRCGVRAAAALCRRPDGAGPRLRLHSDPLPLPRAVSFGEVSGVAVNSRRRVFALSRGNTTGPAYAAGAPVWSSTWRRQYKAGERAWNGLHQICTTRTAAFR